MKEHPDSSMDMDHPSSADIETLQLHMPPSLRTGEIQGYAFPDTVSSLPNHTVEQFISVQEKHTSYRGTILLGLAVLSIMSNVFILIIIVLNRNLRASIANVLLCHLGFLGLVYTILLMPSYTSLALSNTWHQITPLCKFQGYMCSVLTTATMLTLAAISIDKYRTIAAPLHYSTNVNRRKMTLCIVVIWITSFVLCSLPALAGSGYTYSHSKACCDIDYNHTPGGLPRWVTLPVLVIAFYIPGGILIFCYCHIFRIASSHQKRITAMLAMVTLSFQAPITRGSTSSSPPNEQKASRTIGFFLGSFFFCYIPYTVVSIIQVVFLLPINFYVMVTIASLYQSAPVINAIVYGSMNRALRCSVLFTVRKIIYSRHGVNQYNNMREGGTTPVLSRRLSVKTEKLRQVKSSPFLQRLGIIESNMRTTCSTPALNSEANGIKTPFPSGSISAVNEVNEEDDSTIKPAVSTPAIIIEINHVSCV